MYISKPNKGFVLPVLYIQNESLFRDNIEKESIEQEEFVNFEDEKRDKLFADDEVFERVVQVKKTYNNEDIKGMLIFDDIINEDFAGKEDKRTTTEIKVENVGKLIFEEDKNEDIPKKEMEVKEEKINERDSTTEEIKKEDDSIIKEESEIKKE